MRGRQIDICLYCRKEVMKSRKERKRRLLTWLQTGLYLSPGLFRIFSSCLRLKLDTPMDLANPASLHFSRAWGGRGGEHDLQWAIEQE